MQRSPLLPALLFGLLASFPAAPARADDAARLALARTLMAQVHEDDALRASMPLLAAQMRKALAAQGERTDASDAFVERFEARISAEIGRYGDTMAEAYAQGFTEDELKAAIAFNDTPAGQKFIAGRPALTQASFLAMQRLSQDVAREVMDDMAADKAQGAAPRKM